MSSTQLGITHEYIGLLENIYYWSSKCELYGILPEPREHQTLANLTQNGFIVHKMNREQLDQTNYCFRNLLFDGNVPDDFYIISWLTDTKNSQAHDFKEITFRQQDLFIQSMHDNGTTLFVFNGLLGDKALQTAEKLKYNVDISFENANFFTTRVSIF